jgi:cytochrome c oxidase subunit 2
MFFSPQDRLKKRNLPQRRFSITLLLLLLGLLSAACFPEHPQSTFDAAGPVAKSQLDLFYIVFWAAVLVFIVVEGALLYAVVRYRRRQGQGIPAQTHGNTPLEIAWTIAPALILAAIAVPTIMTIFDNARIPDTEDTVYVSVTGHQWWFEFEYFEKNELDKEEADLKRVKVGSLKPQDVYQPVPYLVTANELHVPVGRPVGVILRSDDVIHSFWIPKLAGKVDVVPGNRNTMWFQADKAGEFFGQCAEFCGIAHAQMRFLVIAEGEAEWNNWVDAQQAPPSLPLNLVFGIKGCAVCHSITGPDSVGTQDARMETFRTGGQSFPAPNLTHFASRGTFAGGIVDRTDENVREWLRDPASVKPGNRMAELAGAYTNPKMALTDSDVTALVNYLQSLK